MYYDRATTVLFTVLRTVLNTCQNRSKFYIRVPGRIWEKHVFFAEDFFFRPPTNYIVSKEKSSAL